MVRGFLLSKATNIQHYKRVKGGGQSYEMMFI
jgi:hypothetical protein